MKSFTRDLIDWIEKNLDKKIILDEVAEKSGYSKWYLQRIFRQETGMKLATYIRERRLSEAAILLKTTGVPVISAAEQFGFANQQAFTRTFAQHFCIPPARYRRTRDWHFRGLQPSLLSENRVLSEPQTTWISMPNPSGIIFSYLCDWKQLGNVAFHTGQRELGLQKAARFLPRELPVWFTEKFEPADFSGQIRFSLTFGYHGTDVEIPGDSPGRFLRFPFEGTADELTELQVCIYHHILPRRMEARRNGHDLFVTNPGKDENLMSCRFRGDYYMPVTDPAGQLGSPDQACISTPVPTRYITEHF